MDDTNTRRLLIILAKYPEAGTVKTRLAERIGSAAATTLYSAFLADLAPRFMPMIEPLHYDVCWLYTPDKPEFPQLIKMLQADTRTDIVLYDHKLEARTFFVGHSKPGLAQHQIQQLKHAQSEGYEQVIIITTDTPHLQQTTVVTAFQLLNENDVVIGPVTDGGYYLLGIRRYWRILENVTMSTDHVATDIIKNAVSANLSVVQLETMQDIDNWDDLQSFIRLVQPYNGALCPQTWASIELLGLSSLDP